MKSLVILLALLGTSCYALGAEKCNPGDSVDFAWKHFPQRDPHEDIQIFLAAGQSETAANQAFGPTLKLQASDDGKRVKKSWAYGRAMEGRTCNATGEFESTYMVNYAIVTVSFDAGQVQSCMVRLRTFIGDQSRPNPFSKSPVADKVKICSGF